MDGCSRDCTHVVLYELRNALVFADALVMLCNTLWSCLHFNYIYCCCLHFVMHLWCCLHFVMDLWCCLGPGKIYILLFVSMFSKCRELTENKYKKKQRGSLPTAYWRQSLCRWWADGKEGHVATTCVTWQLWEHQIFLGFWLCRQLCFGCGQRGDPGFRLWRQLCSGCGQRGDPHVSADSIPNTYGPPEVHFAVRQRQANGKACR